MMYPLALAFHSIMRWGILLWVVLGWARSLAAWRAGRDWDMDDEMLGRSLMMAIFLQGGLGYLLFGELSPITTHGLRNPATVGTDATVRFFTLVHPVAMTLAFFAVMAGRARAQDPARGPVRHRDWFLALTVGLGLMVAATPWPGLAYGRPLLRLP